VHVLVFYRLFVIITLCNADIFRAPPLPRSKQQFSIKLFCLKHLRRYYMHTKWFIEYSGYTTSWFKSQKGSEIFSAPQRQLGPQLSPIPWVAGALPSAAKRLWCELEHSTPSSAEIKDVWNYKLIHFNAFMKWWLMKHTNLLSFYHSH